MNELNPIQIGDKVALYNHGSMYSSTPKILSVIRVTSTQIILENNSKFNKKTGDEVGTTYRTHYYSTIRFLSPELKERIENQINENKIQKEYNQFFYSRNLSDITKKYQSFDTLEKFKTLILSLESEPNKLSS